MMDQLLKGLPGVVPPKVPPERQHVYYQYCVYVPDRDDVLRGSIRRGIDIETLHVDVCTQLPLFGAHSFHWGRTCRDGSSTSDLREPSDLQLVFCRQKGSSSGLYTFRTYLGPR